MAEDASIEALAKCQRPSAPSVELNAKFRLSQLKVSQYTAKIAGLRKEDFKNKK